MIGYNYDYTGDYEFQCEGRGVDEPERSGAAFRHLVFSWNACSGTNCQINRNALHRAFWHLIVTGQKKVIQNFAKEETRNLPEINKTGHLEIFPGALWHFRIYVYTTV